jgi:hypothetical protein
MVSALSSSCTICRTIATAQSCSGATRKWRKERHHANAQFAKDTTGRRSICQTLDYSTPFLFDTISRRRSLSISSVARATIESTSLICWNRMEIRSLADGRRVRISGENNLNDTASTICHPKWALLQGEPEGPLHDERLRNAWLLPYLTREQFVLGLHSTHLGRICRGLQEQPEWNMPTTM